jgi:hypothetical protein
MRTWTLEAVKLFLARGCSFHLSADRTDSVRAARRPRDSGHTIMAVLDALLVAMGMQSATGGLVRSCWVEST